MGRCQFRGLEADFFKHLVRALIVRAYSIILGLERLEALRVLLEERNKYGNVVSFGVRIYLKKRTKWETCFQFHVSPFQSCANKYNILKQRETN